jgi:DNA-binding Lrp family transcriptional regulator
MTNDAFKPHLTLTQTERHILYLVLTDASASVAKIAAVSGYKQHIVQAAYSKFRAHGIIVRRVMIDTFRLGYSRHSLFIGLSPDGQRERRQLTEFLIKHPSVAVVVDVAGEYDIFLSLAVRSPEDLSKFQDLLSARFSSPIQQKDMSICLRHSIFGEKSLISDSTLYAEHSCYVTSHVVTTDPLDRQLLFLMSSPNFSSLAQLSREIKQPFSTIDYRVKKLWERRIICADLHELDGEDLGLSRSIILISMKGFSQRLHTEFHTFAREHPYITRYSHEIGYWDFTLEVSAPSPTLLDGVIEPVYQRFGPYVASLKSLESLRVHKMMDYPFDPSLGTLVPYAENS